MYDYAQVSARTLSRAQHVAGRIIQDAGVGTTWSNCRLSDVDPRVSNPGCNKPVRSADVVLRLLSEWMAKPTGTRRSVFGFAQPPRIASVFFDRVEDMAESDTQKPYVILGHTLAHELGHLLLGRNSHSRKGIMQLPWDKDELKRAEEGRLLFTSGEAERMCSQVLERMRAGYPLDSHDRSRLGGDGHNNSSLSHQAPACSLAKANGQCR